MKDTMGDGPTQFFYELTPEVIMDSLEELGLSPTGRCLALNSMENRVFELEFEEDDGERRFLVGKYYRPGRWSLEQIEEEHQYLFDLKEDEIPAICPIKIEGESIFSLEGEEGYQLYYALFPKAGGRHFEADMPGSLERLGSALARLHQTGRRQAYEHRPVLNADNFARKVRDQLLAGPFIPRQLRPVYDQCVSDIAKLSDQILSELPLQRVHGDCHHGNILIHEQLALVDFDDTMMGPVIQDFWMVLSGDEDEFRQKRDRLAEGYEVFAPYPYAQERAIEVLRSLRMIHYNGWIAKRYEDPCFQQHFPYFQDENFWSTHIHDLLHQRELIEQNLRTL